MQILETHRTFDFPGGGADPLSPLWIRTCDHLRGSGWGGGGGGGGGGSGIHYSLKI